MRNKIDVTQRSADRVEVQQGETDCICQFFGGSHPGPFCPVLSLNITNIPPSWAVLEVPRTV